MKHCFFLFLLTACSWGYQTPPHIKYAEKLEDRFARTYEADHQLVQIASGGGMMNGIECVDCDFAGWQRISIEEGRRLFVNGIESLCATFNNDVVIRPYLSNYPFVQKNIRLMLSFDDPVYDQPHLAPYVSLIFCVRDIIFYRFYDPQAGKYFGCYEEPYEEAVRIIHEERETAKRKHKQ